MKGVHRGNDMSQDLHHQIDHLVPTVGVGAMVLRDGKVLLGKRKGSHGAGTYAWCGGGVEFGESLEAAVAREVRQESGLVVSNTSFICVSNVREYARHYIDFEFLVEAEGEPVLTEPDKGEAWEWYPLDDLPGPLFKPVEIAVESYRKGIVYNP